jgi:predicted secreted protein
VTAHRRASFAVNPPAATSLTITTTASSVTRGKQFILSGLMTPTPGTVGVNVIVWIKKPGKAYYAYSSNRTVYAGVGGVASWQYKYNTLKTQAKGTYLFYVSLVANGTYTASHSVTKTITFK